MIDRRSACEATRKRSTPRPFDALECQIPLGLHGAARSDHAFDVVDTSIAAARPGEFIPAFGVEECLGSLGVQGAHGEESRDDFLDQRPLRIAVAITAGMQLETNAI